MYSWKQALLRQLPSVDNLLSRREIKELLDVYPRSLVVEAIREALEDVRTEIVSMDKAQESWSESNLINRTIYLVEKKNRFNLRRVINATGIMLHTNLGRALLSERAARALEKVSTNYSNLELDLDTGERGSRFSHVHNLLLRLTGAEDCMVVNNNAAAVMLALNTIAKEREVIVSRGQLVEIGGSFRIPEVMEQSGAELVEVGTTNKTYPSDYKNAVNDNTALLLRVHTSNYRIVGFSKETTASEMVEVGREMDVPTMEDLGSGCLVDLTKVKVEKEALVKDIVDSGIDIVTFSGDKLLGGPQAGIIVGKKEYVEEMKKNPLARALRIDKLTAAALEATLWDYANNDPFEFIPTLKMLKQSEKYLLNKAEELQYKLEALTELSSEIVRGLSSVGGGALPLAELPTYYVALEIENMSAELLAGELRQSEPPVITMIKDDRIIFDVRTIDRAELPIVATCVAKALQY